MSIDVGQKGDRFPVVCGVLLLLSACGGNIDIIDSAGAAQPKGAAGGGAVVAGNGAGGAGGNGTLPPGGGSCLPANAPDVVEVQTRRLSRPEYDNTLRDLGLIAADATLAVESFAADSTIAGARRGFLVGGPVDEALAGDLIDAATSIAATATENLTALVGCTPASTADEDACAQSFIASFGRRAYRRPLAPSEQDELLQAFASARDDYDFRTGIEIVLASMLSAPEFIYLVEAIPQDAAPGDVVSVDGSALASRLSYFLWDSTPDEQLLAAAESGALANDAELEREVRRMLEDPRARRAVERFVREWTFIDDLSGTRKDSAELEAFTPELAEDLRASFIGALENTFWGTTPTLANFLGSETMLVNAGIAQVYGLPTMSGDALVETPVDTAQRRGLLTHPAFLSLAAKPSRSDPVHRGLFVREQLLCNDLPSPPQKDENGDPIDFNVPLPTPGVSNRERFAEHTKSDLCMGCHTLIDPIGFGFENYDAIGRFRSSDEGGNPIDASGQVNSGGDVTGPFNGALALVEAALQSETVAECVTRQWFRFALGRRETEQDACSNAKTFERFAASGNNLQELVVALATSDAFRFRKVGAP